MNTRTARRAGAGQTCTQDPDQYLTGVQRGWHAIHRDSLQYAAMMSNGVQVATAECDALVRVAAKHGPYRRASVPVAYDPCPYCAWTVAVATGAIEHELELITPPAGESAALARLGLDPLLPAALCRAILAAAEDRSSQDVIRQLAAVTAHSPGLAISEECGEGDCDHHPCTYPGSWAACWGCSLRTGEEAGEFAGRLMDQGTVRAPCGVLAALAAHYGRALPGLGQAAR
jgi:hypothetical protein